MPYQEGGIVVDEFEGDWHDKWEVRIWPSKSKKGFILYSLTYKGNDWKENIDIAKDEIKDMDPATLALLILLGIITSPIWAW